MSFEMWSGLIALLVLVVVGVPIVFAFAASAALGLYFALGGLDPMINLLQQSALSGIKEYNFIVIPCFTVMGMLIAHCGAASDLFNVVNRGLRGVPGRLAVATVGGNAVFAAVTGVGVAAAAAFSHVAYPAMREARYSRSFATGCIAGSSVLGLLIPPSVFMIVWAILTEQSVGKLFAAGVFPGLLLAFLYAVYCMVYAKLRPSAAPEVASDQQVRLTRGQIGGSLGVGVLIAVTLGGIWFGYFTPTEGSAVGLVGSAILAWAKGMRGRGVFNAFVEAGRTVTPIMLLLLTATIYSKLIALNGIPQEVQAVLESMGLGTGGTLLFMVAVWFLLGAMIDSISIMLLTVPIFWPVAQALGIDPIMFALIGILVIEAGVLTPPFGIGVFVVKAAIPDRNIKVSEIFMGSVPYWVLILFLAWLIYAWPPLATWLPSHI
ncbi:MAG: TRAP transporter large permease subunit [Hydrogenophaga sp.]|uniref:TRAP transporter large permease n=1 Tax=Hydrogenophaga sp. TaxID=1904254 RepID=UPI001D47A8FD|nr:TRAP transporter large permease subunit [Hydrogenophaga sp.]MBW0171724.1 TRAP transporter large permease subunit [Hydrogenophaga sp.]MBW0184024.1 TRAP transporter large permease subunit [Hydrogenophaga sp.]